MVADFIGAADLGDLNGDGLADTRLDAVIAGLEGLAQGLVDSGRGAAIEIGLIPFAADASRAATLRAGAEVDGDSVLDLIEQLRALELGGGTDYGQAFEVAVEFFEDQPAATNLVSFLSDGRGFGECADELALLTDPAGFDATL